MAPRQEAEHDLQVSDRPRVACDLDLAGGEHMRRLRVPHLERDHDGVPHARERERPAGFLSGDTNCDLEGPGECRCRCSVSVSQADREGVEQEVNRPRLGARRGRGARGGRDRGRAAGHDDVAGERAP